MAKTKLFGHMGKRQTEVQFSSYNEDIDRRLHICDTYSCNKYKKK